jgi:hypothetical protein
LGFHLITVFPGSVLTTTGDGVCLLLHYSKGTWLARQWKICSSVDPRPLDHVDEEVLRVQHHSICCVVVDSLFFVHVGDLFWEDTSTIAIFNHGKLGQGIENLIIINLINYYHYWFNLF